MARSSAYSTLLSIAPKWALGGDFGDITNLLNSREKSYEDLAQEQLLTQETQYQVDAQERKRKLEDALKEKLGGQKPATLKDAYNTIAELAYQSGEPLEGISYQAKIDSLEKADRARKLNDLSGAASVADNLTFDELEKYYPGVMSKDSYEKNQKTKRAATEKTYPMVDPKTGEIDPAVPYGEAMRRQKEGYKFIKLDPGLGIGIGADSSVDEGPSLVETAIETVKKKFFSGEKTAEEPTQQQKKIVEDIQAQSKKVSGETIPRADLSGPPRPPRPGMKWQQNKKTGEYREVPK